MTSDDRSIELFRTRLETATQMQEVLSKDFKPNCRVIDEIDGAPAVMESLLQSPSPSSRSVAIDSNARRSDHTHATRSAASQRENEEEQLLRSSPSGHLHLQ